MKKTFLILATIALAPCQLGFAQTSPSAAAQTVPAPTAWAVVSSDAISHVWERTVYEAGPKGTTVARKHRYTELCTGLNYRDPVSGQWQPSREEIDLLPPGSEFAAAATNGQHQAWFPLNIAQGIIQLKTADGKQLQSRPVGLFFEDDSNSVLIAVLTNSVGELVGSNQVVYPSAFEGAAASLRYKYTRAGFEQDVVVQGQLPDPSALGLNAARARLGVLTAFFDTNQPVATPGPTNPVDGLRDLTLTFGAMRMGRGRAFSIGNTAPAPPSAGEAPTAWLDRAYKGAQTSPPTYKRWFQLKGRDFLMEEVPYRRVAAQLSQLPPMTGRLEAGGTNLYAADSFLDTIPARLLSCPATGGSGEPAKLRAMRLSQADGDLTRGLVVDYVTMTSTDAYNFYGDTTYYIAGPCYITDVIIEGGTVIKYPNFNTVPGTQIGADPATAFIEVDGTLTCQTSTYHPAVFTAADDDTIGEQLPFSQHNPAITYYANPAIYTPGDITLSNVCIRYAAQGILIGEGNGITLLDSQVVDSQTMAVLGLGDGLGGGLTCKNCLFDGNWGGVAVYDSGSGYDYYIFDNCTLDKIYTLATGTYPNYNYCNANNSIFANINYPDTTDVCYGNNNGFYLDNGQAFGSPLFSCTDSPFQTAGGGSYYLNNDPNGGLMFQGVGGVYTDPPLTNDLAVKTTRPPVVYDGVTISSDNFTVQVQRDTESPGPDLGYHYDPLDYVFSNCTVYSTMTFPAGTAVGWQNGQLPGESPGQKQGLSFPNSTYGINFDGIVNHPCYFVRCNTVQETDNSGDGTGIAGSGQNPSVNATFTRFAALGDLAPFLDANAVLASFACSEFWSGLLGGSDNSGGMNLTCQNCLFVRSSVDLQSTSGALQLQNCTFHGGSLTVENMDADPSFYALINDTAFDGTVLSVNNPNGSLFSFSHNAYFAGAIPLPTDQNDVTGSNPSWQNGPLGNFYLPGNSQMINAGDRQASQVSVAVSVATAGTEPLSAFTTQTSQQLDSSLVDIGYHYHPEPLMLISGHSSYGAGDIFTYDFPGGALLENPFTPHSAGYGRGLAIYNGSFYYTVYGGDTNIHICSYGIDGSGPSPVVDSGMIINPDNRTDASSSLAYVGALAFHYDPNTRKTELYALTGYGLYPYNGNKNYPEVWEIDPGTGKPVSVPGVPNPITILTPADPNRVPTLYSTSDGFTVLPNGDFLINDYDGGDGCTVYREYYSSGSNAGQVRDKSAGGLYVDLSQPPFNLSNGTGVTVSPDGTSLYFFADNTLVQTDLSGTLEGAWHAGGGNIEDIDAVILQ